MGLTHSTSATDGSQQKSPVQTYSQITQACNKAYSTIELETLQRVFSQLATPVSGKTIWTQDTFSKFLELPDQVATLIFLSTSYVASFPYTHESPVVLDCDAVTRVVAIFTGRMENILSSRSYAHLIFNSIATSGNPMEKEKVEHRIHKDTATVDSHESELFGLAESNMSTSGLRVSKSTFTNFITFMLTIQQKSNFETVSHYIEMFTGEVADKFQETAFCIVNTISSKEEIAFDEFLPFFEQSQDLFKSYASLFSHFLFPANTAAVSASTRQEFQASRLMNAASASQLSLFLPRELVYGKHDHLYQASHDGFSMASFETKVLRYPGPTVLLLEGRSKDNMLYRFGLFSTLPWKQSSKDAFQDRTTTLFQLAPRHRSFKQPDLTQGIWFSKAVGIGIGCKPPKAEHKAHDYEELSLVLDSCLEVAVFRDIRYHRVVIRVNIQDVEVWGLGGDKEAQRKAWEWEENEANRRRNINVKDMQADYGKISTAFMRITHIADLLEMAGLVGQNRSGGSV